MDLNVRIAGEAGQGLVTAGDLLSDVFADMGLYVFASRNYESRIRGGVNWYDVRAGEVELFSRKEDADILVAFSQEAAERLREEVSEDGTIICDSGDDERILQVDLSAEAKELVDSKVMANSVALGVVFGLMGYDADTLCELVGARFKKAGDEVVENNLKCIRRGIEIAQESGRKADPPEPADAPPNLCDGATALGLGAATAGVKVVSGYPMTPGTGVLTYLAQVADEYGIVFEQAEDELAAINMVCGAVYAGVPALTSTSGGGFSLMCEGLSLAGIMELPVFIVLAQRPGPATGLPTRTAQEDLKFAINAGHGEFPRAVYAPGSQKQCFEIVRRGLEIAHKYQSPAILLTDQFLMASRRNVPEFDRTLAPIDHHVENTPGEDYVRYAMAKDGVSPRAVPGGDVFVICDSDEHDEKGHITEDFDTRIRQHEKRLRKQDGLSREMIPPERYGADDAETLMLCWGSTYMPCREAVDALNESGESVAMVHFPQVWPLAEKPVSEALQGVGDGGRVISLELNATGQLASVLLERGFLSDVELILRYDGRPFSAEEIVERFQQ